MDKGHRGKTLRKGKRSFLSIFIPFFANIYKTRSCLDSNYINQDSDSSADLSLHLQKLFSEDQLYRIDHYLGKNLFRKLEQHTMCKISRQGDGPEPHLSTLLKHDLRSNVEPRLHCKRHHHLQGTLWNPGTRRILWRVWNHQRRYAEPPSSGIAFYLYL